MSIKIVILGSINRDFIAMAKRLPKPGETVDGLGQQIAVGGKGSNQAVQASLLNAEVYFIGCVGSDENGRIVKDSLASKGVKVDYLYELPDKQTGNCTIYVAKNGDNMLVYYPGANKMIEKRHIDNAAHVIRSADILMTQTEINMDALSYGLKLAKDAGVRTLLNPGPAVPLDDGLFPLIDYITPNETEAEEYTGILRPGMDFDVWKNKNAAWFLRKGTRSVCITLGKHGSYYNDGRQEITIPAFQVNAVDSTAAGDAFNAGFAVGVAGGKDVRDSLLLANACGALATERIGAHPSICSKSTIDLFLQKNGHYAFFVNL